MIFKQGLRLAAFVLLAGATAGCERDSDLSLPLAVNSNKLALAKEGGSTHIMIYSQGDWGVRFDREVDWGALNVLAGTGNSDVVFSYSENLEAPRRVNLIISNAHGIDTVTLVQEGFNTELAFKKTEVNVPRNQARILLPLKTNIREQFKRMLFRITDPDAPAPEEPNTQFDHQLDVDMAPEWYAGQFGADTTAIGFNIAANNTGEPRRLKVEMIFQDGNLKVFPTSIIVTQTVEEPTLAFQNTEQEISRPEGEVSLKLATDLTYSIHQCKTEVTYQAGNSEPWLSGFHFGEDVLTCRATENTTGADRKATITLSYPLEGGQLEATMTLVQTSSDLRILIPGPTGSVVVEDNFTFEGIVISDAGNPNLETNPNKSISSIDFTENDKTAYVQRTNGAYGFRLKFTDAADNTLKRYSHVILSAKGLTLTKEENPTRYTLSGLTDANIVSTVQGEASDLRAKTRKIAELTDDDVYTFVTLDNVQIGINDGCYTNVTDGYQLQDATINPSGTTGARTDCTPLAFFDNSGRSINLLVNAKTPWRRTGNGVPAGSGALNGILVHSELLRFGYGAGNIGRYAIRALEETEIALDKNEGFAQTLVEWNWNDKLLTKNDDGTLKPNIGTGSLCSTIAALEGASAYAQGMSYNNKVNTGTGNNAKGQLDKTAAVFNCGASNSWWNFTTGNGEAIVADFSTSGLSASGMVLIFDILGGTGGNTNNKFPTYWQVEYSLDGKTFTKVDNSQFGVRPLVWWSNTALYNTPGLAGYVVKLPAEQLVNKSKVWVALRAADTVCCQYNPLDYSAAGAESNRLTASSTGSGPIRISTFSVKYY